MRDYRNEFVRCLQSEMISYLDPELCDKVAASVIRILDAYELTERSTSIIQYDDTNTRLIKMYMSSMALDGKSQNTAYVYMRQLKRFIDFTKGKNLKETDTFDIRNYLAQEKTRGLSNVTLENTRAILGTFFQWLVDEEYILRNPCAAVHPIKCTQEIKRPFSTVEQDALKGCCETDKERAMVEVLLSSGVRVSELVDLNVEDIDFNRKSVRIRHGKGDKERCTYIDDVAQKYLVKYLIAAGIETGPLFQTRRHDRYTPAGVRYMLNNISKRADVKNVHPHRFRRTFATTLAARGMKLQDIQRLMGHTDINTTMRYITINDTQVHNSYQKYTA